MARKTINLGKVMMTTGGDYDLSKNYARLTCVFYNNVSWVSRKDVPAGISPGTNEAYWQKISERGGQGIQGPVGPQGNSAFDGTGVEIVNDLTTGGEAAVLSAEQGKILKQKLDNVIEEVKGVEETQSQAETRLTSLENLAELHRTQLESHDVAIEDLQDNKVDKGDYAPALTAGFADNLVSGDVVVDSEFNVRQSGGGAIADGVARMEVVKGNSVVWNQMADTSILSASGTHNGITYTFANNEVIANGTASGTSFSNNALSTITLSLIGGHKYFIGSGGGTADAHVQLFSSLAGNVALSTSSQKETIVTCPSTQNDWLVRVRVADGKTLTNEKFRLIVRDLTLMFGSGNEPTTIEEFYARIPQNIDLYAYNEGEIVSTKVDAVKSVGRNVWDEQWEAGTINDSGETQTQTAIISKNYNKILPNTTYCLCYKGDTSIGNTVQIGFWDADKNFISRKYVTKLPFITPTNAAYFKIATNTGSNITTYNNDICINLSDPDFDGQYEPYKEDVRELPAKIKEVFPDGMKSAGTAHDVVYNDLNKEVGVLEKRIGVVDLGSLTWTYSVDFAVHISNVVSDLKAQVEVTGNWLNVGLLCEKYKASEIASSFTGDKQVYVATNKTIRIKDSAYTDAASFKAAMSGVMLYYELATPEVTEHTEPFNLDYQVTNGGQEEAIATETSAPFAADIKYGFNAAAKIKENANEIAQLKATIAELQTAIANLASATNVEETE